MRYRIKIKTFASGRKEFTAYVKQGLFWYGINWKGETVFLIGLTDDNREDALEKIDLHNKGNDRVVLIDFEYIVK